MHFAPVSKALWLAITMCCSCLLLTFPATALSRLPQVNTPHYEGVDVILNNLSSPWDIAFIDEKEVLITEKAGTLKRVNLQTQEWQDIAGVPQVADKGQGGLFSVALHPDFSQNQLIYLSYTAESAKGKLQIQLLKATLQGSQLANKTVLFKATPTVSGGSNLGGALLVSPDNQIYLSVGEHTSRKNLQSLKSHLGTIIRLNVDGSVPGDNPFVSTKGAHPEIYSYGHRNPQGMTMDSKTGDIWVIEHGPRGGDEVNKLEAGANYGWPVVTYGVEYSGRKITDLKDHGAFTEPYFYYTPSIAPSDIILYQQGKYPQWQNHFLVGALRGRHISVLKRQNNRMIETEKLLEGLSQRIRAVKVSPTGLIFLLTDNGELLRLQTPLQSN